jgi:hypothetical protein
MNLQRVGGHGSDGIWRSAKKVGHLSILYAFQGKKPKKEAPMTHGGFNQHLPTRAKSLLENSFATQGATLIRSFERQTPAFTPERAELSPMRLAREQVTVVRPKLPSATSVAGQRNTKPCSMLSTAPLVRFRGATPAVPFDRH